MKLIPRILVLATVLLACASSAQSNVYSLNIVGYVNHFFLPGDNLFGNPLLNNTSDALSTIIPAPPDGSTVSLWNSSAKKFSQTSLFQDGAWSVDLSIHPGAGALLNTPSGFTNTFVGTVLAPDGSVFSGDTANPPPVFSGPMGVYLLASPFSSMLGGSSGLDVFLYILGRAPQAGDQFITLDPATQQYHVSTFSSGAWNNGDPVLQVSDAAFFNVGGVPFDVAVPEPGCPALGLLGVALLLARRRLKQIL